MPKEILDIEFLKSQAPKAWLDIVLSYKRQTNNFEIEFEKLPFVLQLGIFKIYFEENGTDIDFNNLNLNELLEEITQLIIKHENVVKHFS